MLNSCGRAIHEYLCVILDTGAPYVLYKDGMDRAQMQWDSYVTPQQTSSGAGSPQQACGPAVPLGVEADSVTPRDQSLPSPAPSPYPATQAEPREDEIQTGIYLLTYIIY